MLGDRGRGAGKNYYAVLGLAQGCRDEAEIKRGEAEVASYCVNDH